ncbi:unnamed protein product [Protopolystoma xenopodis]|uniref:Uncharacterized protein n=1 Tax=Protopolystoma xenopodis TaxID=117903 RepID=A0A3S5CT67_9PLAT|nr:unnamed protein product [Protopolystoma xenopodis]
MLINRLPCWSHCLSHPRLFLPTDGPVIRDTVQSTVAASYGDVVELERRRDTIALPSLAGEPMALKALDRVTFPAYGNSGALILDSTEHQVGAHD